VLVHRNQLSLQTVVRKEPRRDARVLRGDHVGAGKGIKGARADVFEVPNGRGDHI
jgi:hypothetical protein